MRFPGRRGDAAVNDYHLRPLSFREFVALEGKVTDLDDQFEEAFDLPDPTIDLIFDAFDRYLLHGGYLTAINDMAAHGAIRQSTLATYSDWIRGDVLKRGKQEAYLREVLSAIVTRYTSQVTVERPCAGTCPSTTPRPWRTTSSYSSAWTPLPSFRHCGKTNSVRRRRKPRSSTFCDPFILHAVRAWLEPSTDPFEHQVLAASQDPVWASQIVEACVANHFRRFYPTYYIKAQGEVDIAYVRDGRFWPVEIKWTSQMRPKTLKQIARYDNGEIWSKSRHAGEIKGVNVHDRCRLSCFVSAMGLLPATAEFRFVGASP